eukprot:m.279992 g.279992  ORF g.279992 m.279992 type:complete len:215 (-) comp26974_c0_seq22:3079-3723(-)
METTHEDDAHGSQSAALEHPYVLTDDQVRAFFFDGWLQIPDFYSPDTLREISRSTDALEELCAAGPSPVGEMANGVVCKRVVLDTLTGRHVPTRVENFVESSPFFANLKFPLEHLVGRLFDDTDHPARLYTEKIEWTQTGGNGYFPHYDGPSCALLGLASEFITVAVAIDNQTVESGYHPRRVAAAPMPRSNAGCRSSGCWRRSGWRWARRGDR